MPEYRVALSYPGEQRPLVSRIAERLAGSLGREGVFYDRFHEADLAQPNLDLYLLDVYRNRSALVVVFLGIEYARKNWTGLEGRAVRELILAKQTHRIMPVRVDDGEVPGFLATDGGLDAQRLGADAIADLILERLLHLESAPASPEPGAPAARFAGTPTLRVTRPGVVRGLLDRALPRLHRALTRLGTLSEPPELPELEGCLRDLRAQIENTIRDKTYLPLQARDVPAAGPAGAPTTRSCARSIWPSGSCSTARTGATLPARSSPRSTAAAGWSTTLCAPCAPATFRSSCSAIRAAARP